MTQPRPTFRHIQRPLDVSNEELAKFSESRGIPSLVTPATETTPIEPQIVDRAPIDPPRTPTSLKTPTAKKTAPASKSAPITTRLGVKLPMYLSHAVNLRAAEDDCTARHLVIKGLQAIGFHVEDDDLIPDGRRSPPKLRRS